MKGNPCNISGDNCDCPAGIRTRSGAYYEYKYSKETGAKFNCYRCGMPVCEKCSQLIDYYIYGEQRICNDCIQEVAEE